MRQLLAGVARCRGKFGVGAIAEVLTGAETERNQRSGLNQLSTFGILKAHPVKRVIAMLHRVMESGPGPPEGPRRREVPPRDGADRGRRGRHEGRGAPPGSLADLIPRRPPAQRTYGTADPFNPISRNPPGGPVGAAPRTPRNSSPTPRRMPATPSSRTCGSGLARDKQVPAYCICHDSTLRAIARACPGDADALAADQGHGAVQGATVRRRVPGRGAGVTRSPLPSASTPGERRTVSSFVSRPSIVTMVWSRRTGTVKCVGSAGSIDAGRIASPCCNAIFASRS